MIRNGIAVAFGCAVVFPALAGSAARNPRLERKLAPGGIGTVAVLELDCPTVFAFDRGGMRLDLRADPDGLVEVVRARSAVDLTLAGPDASASDVGPALRAGPAGGRVSIRLNPGDRVSLWPVRWLDVRGGVGRLVVSATAADWAFTVRADEFRGDALAVDCDGTPRELKAGGRLDLDREGAKTVFRLTGGEKTGEKTGEVVKVVEDAKPPPEPPKPPEPQAEAPSPRADADPAPPLPSVTTEREAGEAPPAAPVSP